MLFTTLKSIKPFSTYRYKHIESLNVVPLHIFYTLPNNSKSIKPASTKNAINLKTINANQMLFTPLNLTIPFSIYLYLNCVLPQS